MDNNHKDIEKFIDGLLTPPEMDAFRQRLKTDTALAKAYKSELHARSLITEAGRLDLKDTLERFDAEMDNGTKVVNPNATKVIPIWRRRALPIAAMLLIFVAVYTVLQNDNMTTSEVYDIYFQTYEAPSVVRDATGNERTNWDTASQLYSEKKYRDAIPYFTRAQQEVPQYLSEYYKGMCNLNLDGAYYQRAITALDIVLESDNDYREQAQWYKALTLLKMNQLKDARTLFETIAAQQTFNYQQAEEILKLKWKQ